MRPVSRTGNDPSLGVQTVTLLGARRAPIPSQAGLQLRVIGLASGYSVLPETREFPSQSQGVFPVRENQVAHAEPFGSHLSPSNALLNCWPLRMPMGRTVSEPLDTGYGGPILLPSTADGDGASVPPEHATGLRWKAQEAVHGEHMRPRWLEIQDYDGRDAPVMARIAIRTCYHKSGVSPRQTSITPCKMAGVKRLYKREDGGQSRI